MRMIIQQKMFSLRGRFNVIDEYNRVISTVEGALMSFGQRFTVFDMNGSPVGEIRQKVFRFRPTYEIYSQGRLLGTVRMEFSLFKPQLSVDFMGWRISGDYFELNYTIYGAYNEVIAVVSKDYMRFADTYFIDIYNPNVAFYVLMVVLAIDLEKEARN